jgi:predicted RNA methylase
LLDLVIWDPPFGLHSKDEGFKWDVSAPDEEQILGLLDQLTLLHSDSHPAFFMYIHVDKSMFVNMIKAFSARHLQWEMFQWVKTKNVSSVQGRYVSIVEYIFVVTIGEPSGEKTHRMPRSSLERPNVRRCPAVAKSAVVKRPDGRELNGAQKPDCIARMFARDLTFGGPNSLVIVLGSGSGSEVIGSLRNGNSVIAFELDPDQFKGTVSRLNEALGAHEKYVSHMPIEEQPAYLFSPPESWQYTDADLPHFDEAVPVFGCTAAYKEKKKAWRALIAQRKDGHEQGEEVKKPDQGPQCFSCGDPLSKSSYVVECQLCHGKACENCMAEDAEYCEECYGKRDVGDRRAMVEDSAPEQPEKPLESDVNTSE